MKVTKLRRKKTAKKSPCNDNKNKLLLLGHSLHLTKLCSNKYNSVNYLQCSPHSCATSKVVVFFSYFIIFLYKNRYFHLHYSYGYVRNTKSTLLNVKS